MDTFKATKAAEYYMEPTPEEMQSHLRMHGMGELQDITTGLAANNAASYVLRGGEVKDSFLDPTTTSDPQQAAIIQGLLENVNFSTLKGQTPTQMAASFAAAINSESGGLSEITKRVKNGQSLQQIADKINQRMNGIQRLAENEFAKQILGIPDQAEVKLASLNSEMEAILMAMSQVSQLGFIKSKKRTAPVQDDEGNITKPGPMDSYDQLPLLWQPELIVDPQFELAFLQMELDVEQTFKTHDVRQVVDLEIDRSGSMHPTWKQGFVKAILLFYMGLVKKGTTTLYVSTFETKSDGHTRIENELEAKEYYEKYYCGGGGTTDINRVIQDAQASIAQNKLGNYSFHSESRPEIVIINDGQDPLDPSMPTTAPVYSITLEESNPALKELCERSGGSYHEFHGPNARFNRG